MTNKLLEGKKALITGSRRGIGAGIAQLFAEHGADVGINDITRDNEAEKTIASIETLGRKASWHHADVGNSDDRTRMLDEFIEQHGRIDILVNNAVASADVHFTEITEELWDHLVGHALKGYLFLSQGVVNRMIEHGHGGSIINISSTASLNPSPGSEPYGAAKSGLNALTRSFAFAYGPKVRVNCIVAGPFLTDISKAWDLPAFEKNAKANLALQRGGQPDEIVGAALYLASPATTFTTGTTIRVDGGTS